MTPTSDGPVKPGPYMQTTMTLRQWTLVAISAALHFLVDGVCACCLYLVLASHSGMQLLGIFMTYNVLAFLTQPLSGLWADRMAKRHWMLLTAVVLLTLGVAATAVCALAGGGGLTALWVPAVLLGMGNSLFHVWGGKQTVLTTGNDIRALGVFVSTGALGLTVGLVCCSWPLLFVMLMAVCGLSLGYLFAEQGTEDAEREAQYTAQAPQGVPHPAEGYGTLLAWAAMAAVMLVVMGRSYVGEAFTVVMTKTPAVLLTIGATAMVGKMAGGWIARGMGLVRSMALVVVLVVVCLVARGGGMGIQLLGLLMVNCTMAVTLYLANIVLKGREGLAFGLLAAALMPGYLLANL